MASLTFDHCSTVLPATWLRWDRWCGRRCSRDLPKCLLQQPQWLQAIRWPTSCMLRSRPQWPIRTTHSYCTIWPAQSPPTMRCCRSARCKCRIWVNAGSGKYRLPSLPYPSRTWSCISIGSASLTTVSIMLWSNHVFSYFPNWIVFVI